MIIRLDIDGDCNLEKIDGVIVDVEKSTNGGCHVAVYIPVDGECVDVMAAIAMGSDPTRGLLDLIRCLNGIPYDRLYDVKIIRSQTDI